MPVSFANEGSLCTNEVFFLGARRLAVYSTAHKTAAALPVVALLTRAPDSVDICASRAWACVFHWLAGPSASGAKRPRTVLS